MNRSIIVYGPQGCGKTTNAKKLAAHFGLGKIVDDVDYRPTGTGWDVDTLYLTQTEPVWVTPDWLRVLSFYDAMALVKSGTLCTGSYYAILSPLRMPARDDEGWVSHPDLSNLVADGDEGDDLPIDDEKVATAGYRAAYVSMDSQVQEGDPAFEAYWTQGNGVAQWKPNPPDGEGWRLIAVYDTEHGPWAMFVQPLAATGGAA